MSLAMDRQPRPIHHTRPIETGPKGIQGSGVVYKSALPTSGCPETKPSNWTLVAIYFLISLSTVVEDNIGFQSSFTH